MRIDSPKMTNSNATGSFTGSFAGDGSLLTGLTTASYIEFSNVDLGVTTLLSSSAQIGSDISGSFTSLSQSVGSDISDIIDGTQIVASASSAIFAVTASYADNFNAVSASIISLSASYIDLDPLPDGSEPAYKEGRIFYSAENGALSVYNSEADITLQVGQEFYKKAKNATLNTILNGTPVRISGSVGSTPYIYPATAEDHSQNTAFENHIVGVATHDITSNAVGFVTEKGLVNLLDTSGFNAGDILYLQTGSPATPSDYFVNVPPPFPYDIIQVGMVVSSHPTEGIIEVNPKEPVHFGNISGLSGSATEPGQLWIYMANGSWSPGKTLSGSYTIDNGGLTANSFTGSFLSTNGVVSSSIQVDHDQTTNFVANEHIDHSTVTLTAGDGLLGGGDITTSRTFSVDGTVLRTTGDNVISSSAQVDHDQTTNFVANEHINHSSVSISAGDGLSGGGDITTTRTLSVDGTVLRTTGNSVISGSSQVDHDQTTNFVANEHIDHTTVSVIAGDGLTGGGTIAANRTLNVNPGDGIQIVSDAVAVDSTVIRTTGGQSIGGTTTFTNINVNGTGSFAYIQSVTGSAKIIGDAYIVLNNNVPTERYAGIKVFDSGSTLTTASLEFDGQTNDWFYEYSDDGGSTVDHGAVLFGPEYSTKGSPTYPTSHSIQKGTGTHHLADSNITDNGSLITLGTNTDVNGTLDATNLAIGGTTLDQDIATLTLPASTTISTFGASLVDDADAATARTTLGVDPAGTDNSTDVTLNTTSHDYLSLSGQQITLGTIDISDDTNLAAGTGIDLVDDTVSVDVSDFMTNGSNNRVVTATGTDGMNAEANLTFDGNTLVVTGNGSTYSTPDNTNVPNIYIYNSSTVGTGHSILTLRTNNTTGGDPFISFDISGEAGWAFGMDNTDNAMKLNYGWNSLTSATRLTVDTSGNATFAGSVTATSFSGNGASLTSVNATTLDSIDSTQFLRSDTSDTITGVLTIQSSNDNQLLVQGTDTWAGIGFDDTNSSPDYIWYHGTNQTFAIGGGGANVAGKKLHVDGGMSIGSSADSTATPTNGLYIEGSLNYGGFQYGSTYKSQGDYAWHWYGKRYDTYLAATRSNLYAYFYDNTAAPLAEVFVDTFDMNSVNYMGENIWGDVHQYHAIFSTHIYVKRKFSVTNVTLNGDDPYALWVDGKYVAGADSCCTGTTYSHTFSVGWHKLDLIYSEGGGGHYVSLGWNPKDYTDYIAVMNPFGPVSDYDKNGYSYVNGTLNVPADIIAYSTSDHRLKSNFVNLENAVEKISRLNGYKFVWIEDKSIHQNFGNDIGVIAQEVEEIFPEVVITRENGYKAVKYEKLIPVLIEAIKEQQKQIEELKQSIDK